LFGLFEESPEGVVLSNVRLTSDIKWEEVTGENVYCLIEGTHPERQEELVLVEAFYDSTAHVYGHSPGADEAISVATLLEVARNLKETPPERTVLLVATGGHAQSLAGMRELIWSLRARSKDLRKMRKGLQNMVKKSRESIDILGRFDVEVQGDKEFGRAFQEAIGERIKTEVDSISRTLMRLRMQKKEDQNQDLIQDMAAQRLLLRRLGWRKTFQDLSPKEQEALNGLIPLAIKDHEGILSDAQAQLKMLKDARAFRALVKQRELAAVVSLHLSSHGDGMGAFNQGWLYWLKPTINRIAAYSKLEKVLREGASEWERSKGLPSLFRDTLRPSKRRSWQSWFLDHPPLGGEVSALAGYLGVSLVTVQDARQWWGTPYDLPEKVNWEYALQQSTLVTGLVRTITRADELQTTEISKVGFSTVTGEAKFLRHGELFPDQPAPGSMILAYQGPMHYYAMVDSMGVFRLKGMADKRHVYDKVIIEGYKFDSEKGTPVWAIDKKQTGKDAYRLKMYRRSMKTKLVMFASKPTTLFNLLEPRSFRYMTKINVLDGRREAKPLRYWWSRIDTRSSVLAMINLDEGTPLKFLLSDTVLRKKLILINADKERPHGVGYLVDDWPFIHNTTFRVANDMWALLGPRIANLEARGIFNERINKLRKEGVAALNEAKATLEAKQYDRFVEASSRSWALASRVYDDVEKTQKDVLFGVLFYIALFVPFAFCAERFLFSYTNIHKRIIAFCGILLLLIAIIYQVHPAFHLAYSPMVVILAFFIIGLSLIVTLIIFFRFEEEMTLLQSRARHMKVGEVNRWKAFAAAFFLGVANLRRRRLRTILTCVTLIILTFTIMSFTSVKSTRHHSRIQYKDSAPYEGFLFKNFNWRTIPSEAIGVLSHTFEKDEGMIAPRVWLESGDLSRPRRVPVRFMDQGGEALGMVGLSAAEVPVSGIDSIFAGGRWFDSSDTYSVLLPDRMAQRLGIDSKDPEGSVVQLWGMPFKVVGTFYGQQFKEKYDLDGEPLTPVTFPHEASMKITEAELEAMESEEDVQAFQSRYQHVPGEQTLIIPYRTLLALGGRLKSIAVRPGPGIEIQDMANQLVDRFGLSLFSGERAGTFLYAASDTLGYSGVPNILIPLLISVFIVLNTMISSVYERKREIAIYTSVGLAPSHVSFLFIAEALAFAVLSVVLGYILAQTSASILSGTSLWAGITVNYSSLAGVAAMILVILVVLVSVIYPSRVAAEIAIPDVNRAWKLPKTDGNAMEVMLPVQLKYEEYKGVGGYVFKYLLEHQNVSHGLFSTGDISIASICPILHGIGDRADECTDDSCCTSLCLNFKARVWLAPFDFGITQKVDVQFCPAPDDPEFLGIKVNLEREAGEANAWRRINKAFLNQMRKQLLMWRSIEKEAQDEYEEVLESPQEGKEGEDFSL
jgi:cell division protein FtsX